MTCYWAVDLSEIRAECMKGELLWMSLALAPTVSRIWRDL